MKDPQKKYKKALYVIFQLVDKFIFKKILKVEITKEAWMTIQKAHKGADHVKWMKL